MWLVGGGPSRLSYRRFWALVNGLPLDGAFAAHLRATARQARDATPQEPPAWRAYFGRTPVWELLADLYDLTHAIAQGGKRIKPYPRDPAKQPRVLTFDELDNSMFGG